MKHTPLLHAVLLLGVFSLASCMHDPTHYYKQKELLGNRLFHDATLSEPAGQSCATCHTLTKGFADIDSRRRGERALLSTQCDDHLLFKIHSRSVLR